MIKGINKQVVEVSETGSDYFERIMFFVKPEYASVSEGKIRERAGIIAKGITAAPPTKLSSGSRALEAAKIILSAMCGAVITLIVLGLLK